MPKPKESEKKINDYEIVKVSFEGWIARIFVIMYAIFFNYVPVSISMCKNKKLDFSGSSSFIIYKDRDGGT